MADDDYTDYVEHPQIPVRRYYWGEDDKGGYHEKIYAAKCYVKDTIFHGAILDDCYLNNCTLNNCIITSGKWGGTDDCTFNNCLIRGTKQHSATLNHAEFVNCRIERGMDIERSMKDRKPKDLAAAQFITYEVMSNVLLTEKAIDYLRRYAWRTKRRLRTKKLCALLGNRKTMKLLGLIDAMEYSMAEEKDRREGREGPDAVKELGQDDRKDSAAYQHNIILENADWTDATVSVIKVPVDTSYDDIPVVWSAKKAGKRLFHINKSYFIEQQLELPLSRMRMYGPEGPWLKIEAEIYGRDMSG